MVTQALLTMASLSLASAGLLSAQGVGAQLAAVDSVRMDVQYMSPGANASGPRGVLQARVDSLLTDSGIPVVTESAVGDASVLSIRLDVHQRENDYLYEIEIRLCPPPVVATVCAAPIWGTQETDVMHSQGAHFIGDDVLRLVEAFVRAYHEAHANE
jgi:hypothetical protein